MTAAPLRAPDSNTSDDDDQVITAEDHDGSGGKVLALRPDQGLQPFSTEQGIHVPTAVAGITLVFSPTQTTLDDTQLLILSPLGMDATWDPRQVGLFLMNHLSSGLDPWKREVYLMRYRDSNAQGGYRYVQHTGIDGFRSRAEDSNEYRGQAGPFWCGTDGEWREIWPHRDIAPYAAKVGIFRSALEGVVWGVAHYDEYAPMRDVWVGPEGARRKTREPSPAWKPASQGGKAALMTAKVAEAQAFRKAFPRRFSQLYIPEEFEQATAADVEAAAESARARREEAMRVAQAAAGPRRETIRVAAATTTTGPAEGTRRPDAVDPEHANPEVDEQVRLLLDEQVAQAAVLDVSPVALRNRYVALHKRTVEDMTFEQVLGMVHAARPGVVAKLRELGHEAEAEVYEHAPETATVAMLFGQTLEGLTALLQPA